MNNPAGSDGSRPELIDDREVEVAGQDRLGHQALAEQIVQLIREVDTPTNIALYGPWGSGKSGIANLVHASMKASPSTQMERFVRFDAFKFAETPLRRNFISAIATELSVDDEKYHGDLYAGVTKTDFTLPTVQIWNVIRTFALALGAVTALLLSMAAALAAAQKGSWHANFTTDSKSFLVAGFPFAALLTGVVGLATKAFGAERRTDRADSDEQFEALFRDLVSDSRADRLVVFVDEIDRCAPHEVVSTLDVVRTFLGVEKCIFIVAADQQVLESALSTDVRQATPDDSLNPYYSTGSAYLDKVFQYQLTVPPLPDQGITHYATQLVTDRLGIWKSIDRETVVSVLIPSHVRSPRRVKHLLNAFVLAHRVAAARHSAGLLDGWTSSRVLELAKLVCLQVEFPLFGRSMVEVPRLPEYVYAAQENPDDWVDTYPYITTRDRELAEEYAQGKRAVDQSLATSSGDPDEDSSKISPVRAVTTQGAQLLDYLSRTASIEGPRQDLIYMQGLGAPFGLPSELADRVIRASQNNQVATIRADLNPDTESAIFELLAQQLRTTGGIEQRNVAAVVLRLLGEDHTSLSLAADLLVTALAPALAKFPDLIDAATMPGLWRLTGSSSLPESERLAKSVIEGELAQDDSDVATAILREPDRAAALSRESVDKLVCLYISGEEAAYFVEQLMSLSASQHRTIIGAAPGLPAALARVWKTGSEASERLTAGAAVPTPAVASPAAATSLAAEEDDAEEAQAQASATTAAVTTWVDSLGELDDKAAVQALVTAVLGADRVEGRGLVENVLERTGVWSDGSGVELILQGAQRRVVELIPKWLVAVNPLVVDREVLANALGALANKLWDLDKVSDSQATDVGNSLGTVLAQSDQTVREEVESAILDTVDSVVEDAASGTTRIAQLQRAQLLVGSCVLRPVAVHEMEERNLADTLESDLEAEADEPGLVRYVDWGVRKLLASWGNDVELPISDEFYDAAQACSWLPGTAGALLRLALQRRIHRIEDEPSLATVEALINESPDERVALAVAWLQARNATGSEVASLLERMRTRNNWTDDDFRKAAELWRSTAPDDQLVQFWEEALANRFSLPPSLVAAFGFDRLDDDAAIAILAKRMKAAKANPDREQVLKMAGSRAFNARTARTQYVEELVIPLFAAGVQATSNALDALSHLGKPVTGDLRSRVLVAVRPAIVDDEKLTKRATEILSGLGFPTRGRGPLGLGGKQLKF